MAKTLSRTAPADIRALPWLDIAAVVALIGWLCSLIYIQQSHQSFVTTDPIIHYFPAAQKVLEGYGYRAFEADVWRGPGYPLTLAVVTRLLGGRLFTAGKVISVASSFVFVLFAYLLLRRVFNSVTALAAILLIMSINTFVWNSNAEVTDIPFACLVMASLYFTARARGPSRTEAMLAGFLGGLALTVRWPGLLAPLFIFARMFLVPRRELGTSSKIQIIMVYLFGFFAASGPWLYVNYLLHGSPLYTLNASNIDPNILPPSESLLHSLLQTLRQEPLGFGLRLMAKLFGGLPAVIQGLNSYPWKWGWVMAGPFWVLIPVGLLLLLMRFDRLKLWFLLISGIWWASMAFIDYQARYYILLFPTFSALAVFPVTGGAWPDLGLEVGKGRGFRFTPGYILARLVGSRLPGWLTTNQKGISLTSLALVGLLAAAALSTVKHIQGSYEWCTNRDGFYHELARFVGELQGSGPYRPIGTRQWSQARYWIPSESGTPVVPLPGEDYESVLPELSYVLYDQIDDDDTLYDWWDDPQLSELADPLHAPANLEAVYYKSDPYRAILYRILDQNDLAGIISATPSSAGPEAPASQVFDDDAQTWWSSAVQTSENTIQSITLDLGGSAPINRVWLLPRPDGRAFPAGVLIEVSQDGSTWLSVVEAAAIAEPVRQSPQILSFSETSARYVRVTATRLRWEDGEEGYLVSLAEVRISDAVERPSELPVFSMGPDDVSFDPLSNELVAEVYSQSEASGQATLEFYEGWSIQDAEHLATVESSVAGPGRVGFARVPFGESVHFEPGHCWPIWAALKPPSYWDLDLDTYGIVRPSPHTVFTSVCSPEEAVVDDFEYAESPLSRGWAVRGDETSMGDVVTVYDRDLSRQVMRISTDDPGGFVIFRWMRAYDRPEMTLRIRSVSNFIVYVRVRDLAGGNYYVQYMPFTWSRYPDEFPEGIYVYYPLGSHLVDGMWHRLERDVYEDFAAKTGRVVDYIEAIAIRAYGELEIADIRLNVHN